MHLNNGRCAKCAEIMKDCTDTIKNWFQSQQTQMPELHASVGYRDEGTQDWAYVHGHTNAKYGYSAHNYKPVPCCDVFFLINGKANYEHQKYKDLSAKLPNYLQSGINFTGLVDADHIEEKDWKTKVKNYPNGN